LLITLLSKERSKKKDFKNSIVELAKKDPPKAADIYEHNFLKALALNGMGDAKKALEANNIALAAKSSVVGWYNSICYATKSAQWNEVLTALNGYESVMLKADKKTKQQFLSKQKTDSDWATIRDEPLVKLLVDTIERGYESSEMSPSESPSSILKTVLNLLKRMDSRISDAAIKERQHWNPDQRFPQFHGHFWHIPFYGETLLFADDEFALNPHAKQFAKTLGDRSSLLAKAVKSDKISHKDAVAIVNGYMAFAPQDSIASFTKLTVANTKITYEKSGISLKHSGYPTFWDFTLDTKTGRVLKVGAVTEDREAAPP
jgi:hypothetical protein